MVVESAVVVESGSGNDSEISFQASFSPSQAMSVDKLVIAFRGRVSFRRLSPISGE